MLTSYNIKFHKLELSTNCPNHLPCHQPAESESTNSGLYGPSYAYVIYSHHKMITFFICFSSWSLEI